MAPKPKPEIELYVVPVADRYVDIRAKIIMPDGKVADIKLGSGGTA